MKKIKIIAGALFVLLLLALGLCEKGFVTEASENISVTIPTQIAISFDEDGTNSISKFCVENDSLLPITIDNVNVTEKNGWQLVEKGSEILADNRKIVFEFGNQCLQAGDNSIAIPVAEESDVEVDIGIVRGAWTSTYEPETALNLEVEYTIGSKQFELTFNPNGNGDEISTMQVYNGETVTLPVLERDYYEFKGWQDSAGNLHNGTYVMPVGATSLTAKWVKTEAYAIYSATDKSLSFYRSSTPISAGSTYNGKAATAVYTGFETTNYTGASKIPWVSYVESITSVRVVDKVSPTSTAYWFKDMTYCTMFDVTNLDTSKVTTMAYMFQWSALEVSSVTFKGLEKFDLTKTLNIEAMFDQVGKDATAINIGDLSNWDVSNVTDMSSMFRAVGQNKAKTLSFGDLSKWDVSKVTDMTSMFAYTGEYVSWYLNLSGWNVSKVTEYRTFNQSVTSKVIAPKWVN